MDKLYSVAAALAPANTDCQKALFVDFVIIAT